MPITKDDVIKALNDPALKRISFSVGQIKVNPEQFGKVADCINAGDITVKSGSELKAYYAPGLNELTTQWGNPPLGYEDLAQILHECTHAIVDINKWNALRLHYLTFYTYAVIRNPVPLPAVKPGQQLSPDARLTFAFKQIVFKYGLHETRGFGAALNPKDIAMLVEVVHAHPEDSDLRDDQRTPEEYLGVPDKHLEMEKAKASWIWHTHPAPSQRRQGYMPSRVLRARFVRQNSTRPVHEREQCGTST